MNYLTRALPASETKPRFALTTEAAASRWKMMGIEPIVFPQSPPNDYSQLHQGIQKLACHMQRSVLDWKREISMLAERQLPSLDIEEIAVMEEALSDITKARFFIRAASSPAWIDWLNERGYLNSLFGTGELSEIDQELAKWLAATFACEHAEKLFFLVSRHETHIHPCFWFELGRVVGIEEESPPDDETLSQWISLLLATSPPQPLRSVLLWLGERCIARALIDDLLKIFDAMLSSHLVVRPRLGGLAEEIDDSRSRPDVKFAYTTDHYSANELWQRGLKPSLGIVAKPLLATAARRLSAQHQTLRVWKRASRDWDPSSFGRQAIEPHEQDKYPGETDVLIDAARDCMEWLVAHELEEAVWWCNQLIQENAPLLRRLAIHALATCTDLRPREKIDWLVTNTKLDDRPARHELFRALREIYPQASNESRIDAIEAALSFQWSSGKPEEAEKFTERHHFDWLHWLHESAPDCELAKNALSKLWKKNPDLEPREHPDLSYWIGDGELISSQSPWSVEELLNKPITAEWIRELAAFQPQEFLGPDWEGLLCAIAEAAKKNTTWATGLAEQLGSSENWSTDLWSGLLNGLCEAPINEDQAARVFRCLIVEELQEKHTDSIARFLRAWIKNNEISRPAQLRDTANSIASSLWARIGEDSALGGTDDWITQAINQPAGILTEFWIASLSLWRQEQEEAPKKISGQYRGAMTLITKETTVAGRLGRCILAHQLSFLLAVDECWTKRHLLPWFRKHQDAHDYQAVWDGFLIAPRFDPQVVEHMSDSFLDAITRLDTHFRGDGTDSTRAERLVRAYTVLLTYYVQNPLELWIPKLFGSSSEADRRYFADEIRHRLARMTADQQREWWNRWLCTYWQNRLNGVPAKLKSAEIAGMLEWLPLFSNLFPDAVDLATQMPKAEIEHSSVLHSIRKSELPEVHPQSVAKLLVFLGKCQLPYAWHDRGQLFKMLLQSDIPSHLKEKLGAYIP